MAKRWMCVMLTVGWLGLAAQALAQALPAFAPSAAPPAAVAPGAHAPCPPPCDPCPVLCPPECPPTGPCLQFRVEYLLWALPRMDLPPLVTVGDFNDPIPGALGQPGTRVLVSGRIGDDNPHNGLRLYLSYGEESNPNASVYGSAFFLQRRYGRVDVSGEGRTGGAVLARPFFNLAASVEDADPVSLPDILAGRIFMQTTRQMYGGEAALRWHYWESGNSRISFLAGPRFLFVEESLLSLVRTHDLDGLGVPGNRYDYDERYSTDNGFYGGQIGAEWQFRLGPVYLGTSGKVALGPIFQNLNTRASTRIVDGVTGTVFTSRDRALYLYPNAVGNFSRTHFAVVPEVSAKLGFDFTNWLGVSVGYSYVYISDVIRPAEFIDRRVNLQPIGDPGVFEPARERPSFRTTSFWAQGIEASLVMRF